MTPELKSLGETLKQQCVLHLNSRRHGHTYGYEITDAGGRKVAVKSVWRGREKGKYRERVVFTMGDAEFETADAFLLAYRQKLRDEEFDAAELKEKTA